MPRTFDGANDSIHCSIGACGLTGAFTIVAVLKRTNNTNYHNICTMHTSGGTSSFGMEIEDSGNGNNLQIQVGASFALSTFSVLAADGWCLVAGGKDAGTAMPRVHKLAYGTGTWTHEGTVTNLGNPASTAGGTVRFGEWEGVDDLAGDLAGAAVFDRNLSDAEVETLAYTWAAWYSLSPVGLWVFDQATTSQTVGDLAGGGANQSAITGTTVSTDSGPPVGYGHDIWIPHSVPAASGTDANAENAAAIGTAEAPSVAVAPSSESAAAAGAANDAQASVAPSAESAAATAAARDVTAAVSVSAECATAAGAANDATASTGGNTSANAECAAATATAQDATTAVAVSAESAAATASALDASVQTGSFTNAAAECATAGATAADPGVSVRPGAELAGATAAVDAASASVAAAAALAAATAIVEQAALAIAASAEVASASAVALNATGDTGVVVVGAGPRITASSPVGRITASTPGRTTTSTGGGRL